MENVKKISSEIWKVFKEFYSADKTTESWDDFIDQGRAIANQYNGPEKRFAQSMFLIFSDYIEEKEYNTHEI